MTKKFFFQTIRSNVVWQQLNVWRGHSDNFGKWNSKKNELWKKWIVFSVLDFVNCVGGNYKKIFYRLHFNRAGSKRRNWIAKIICTRGPKSGFQQTLANSSTPLRYSKKNHYSGSNSRPNCGPIIDSGSSRVPVF